MRSQIYEDYAPNFLVVQPPTMTEWLQAKVDPHAEAYALATYDWRGKYGANALILDTASELGEQLAVYVANAGLSKSGTHDRVSKGSPALYVHPDMLDIGLAQGMLVKLIRLFLAQPMHVFIVGHRGNVDKVVGKDSKGNPIKATDYYSMKAPGQAATKNIGAIFKQFCYITNHARDGDMKLQLNTADSHVKADDYKGKTREMTGLPPSLELPFNYQGLVDVWHTLAEAHRIQWATEKVSPMSRFWKMGLYGESGLGKTTFITSLPEEIFPVVYVGYDPFACTMDSTWPHLLGGSN